MDICNSRNKTSIDELSSREDSKKTKNSRGEDRSEKITQNAAKSNKLRFIDVEAGVRGPNMLPSWTSQRET